VLAARYKNDPRVAMYDVLNEPNNVPGGYPQANQAIHNVLQRFINTIRAQGDNHLVLLEGNGYGNNFDYMEKRTFSNTANLVFNAHRYDAPAYPLPNDVNATGGSANQLGLIGNMTRFRTDNNTPVWVGETGENSAQWMHEAAVSLGTVGIGWCHWTYKRFENGPNAAFMHITPPYVVDGPAGLDQVLENIRFANCVPNPDVVNAISPNALDRVPAVPAVGQTIWLKGVNGKYVSAENGLQAMNCNRDAVGAGEQFTLVDGGGGKLALRAVGKYVSAEDGLRPITCNRPAVSASETFDVVSNADGTISFRGSNGKYVSSEFGYQPMTCTRAAISGTESFTYGPAAAGPLATGTAAAAARGAYPNPVLDRLTYSLPAGTAAHVLTIADAAGRTVLRQAYGNTGPQNAVDASALPGGLYVVRVSGAGFAQSFKIAKQ